MSNINKTIEAIPTHGFSVDWIRDFTLIDAQGWQEVVYTSGPDWSSEIPPDLEYADIRSAAIEYSERVGAVRVLAVEAAQEAIKAIQEGRYYDAQEAIEKGAALEAEYGDCPSWKEAIELVEGLTETSNYLQYKRECVLAGVPPLTKKEWINEGQLPYERSKRESDLYHEEKYEEWARGTGWI